MRENLFEVLSLGKVDLLCKAPSDNVYDGYRILQWDHLNAKNGIKYIWVMLYYMVSMATHNVLQQNGDIITKFSYLTRKSSYIENKSGYQIDAKT